MTNPQPTQEQIKEFWLKLGYTYCFVDGCIYANGSIMGNKLFPLQQLDLNNLFKYAVDEAVNIIQNENEQLYSDEALWYLFDIWVQLMQWYDVEVALFWALWQVKEGGSKDGE